MKAFLFAAALTMSGAALAQDQAPAADQSASAPDNSAPERDSRGIPVVSAPATAPAGANQPAPTGGPVVVAPNQQQVFTPQPAQGEAPPCTREVTDNCTQTYEHGTRHRRPH
jgi:biopolymer transport protein ExbB